MKKKVRYINHLGRSIDLFGDGIYCSSGETADWEWSHQALNGRTAGFFREQREIPLSLIIAAGSEERGLALRNRLFEIAEADVLANVPGAIHVDGWYMRCFVKSSRKDRYWLTGAAAEYELTLLADDPMWIMEHIRDYSKDGDAGGLNHPFDFPFDFASAGASDRLIENPGIAPAPVRIEVFGPAKAPSVLIGGNRHEVEVDVPAGGRLTIDGIARTIVLEDAYGRGENVFSKRRGTQREGGGSYVFERVRPGTSAVEWDGSFAMRVTLFEQSSERRWAAC